jgi:hypothetical protein
MEPFARTIDAAKKYVLSSTLDRVDWNAELVRGIWARARPSKVSTNLTIASASGDSCTSRSDSPLEASADPQDDLAEHVTLLNACVRVRGLFK